MSKFSAAAIGVSAFFVFGGACFATSTVTSTSCLVNISAANGNIGAVPVSLLQTSPTSCGFSGNSGGNPYIFYSIGASATAGSASGGMTGSITTGQVIAGFLFSVEGYSYAQQPSGSFDAYAQSQIESEFTTAGPVQEGVLSFTSAFGLVDNDQDFTVDTEDTESIEVIQNGHSTVVPGDCYYGLDTDTGSFCSTVNVPILLGSSFLIEAVASVNGTSTGQDFGDVPGAIFGAGGTFTIQDANGNAVQSILVTVPEPSTFATIGLSAALLTIALLRNAEISENKLCWTISTASWTASMRRWRAWARSCSTRSGTSCKPARN
jgi:hypothetical protein